MGVCVTVAASVGLLMLVGVAVPGTAGVVVVVALGLLIGVPVPVAALVGVAMSVPVGVAVAVATVALGEAAAVREAVPTAVNVLVPSISFMPRIVPRAPGTLLTSTRIAPPSSPTPRVVPWQMVAPTAGARGQGSVSNPRVVWSTTAAAVPGVSPLRVIVQVCGPVCAPLAKPETGKPGPGTRVPVHT